MVVPDVFAGAQYYKVGDWVTFAWNYTSLVNTPSAVNVIATCSAASAEWTIAGNMSFAPSQTVFWDTNQYKTRQTPQLVLATYTLLIENAEEAAATGAARPGELSQVNSFRFGMYPPQEYVPIAGELGSQKPLELMQETTTNNIPDFTCPMCNSALGGSERQALGFMFGMMSLTILSFTWFATGRFGVF
jgi:hypothetical protein